MDPQANTTSGLDLPQSGADMGQLPPIHTPQSFRAPDTASSHFATSSPSLPSPTIVAAPTAGQSATSTAVPTVPPPLAPLQAAGPAAQQPTTPPAAPPAASSQQFQIDNPTSEALALDDTDTAFDEEWVAKAREVVERTRSDPYMQSKELSKLKAQYIKLRYNKEIKVGD